MSQRRLLLEDDDELPVRRRSNDWSWPARWRMATENPPEGTCGKCGGTGWEALHADGGTVCSKCGGSGHKKERK